MDFEDFETEKKIFSIKDISQMFEVKPSLIRFYEKEFDFLQPMRHANNRRYFSYEQIEQLKIIFTLTREHHLTLEGVKKFFKNATKQKVETVDFINTLQELREFLSDLSKKI